MRQTARIISTYSADVFGVCSALFELGGMTVMHDASGCNSTYTTHDEPRWYDMESMVYISGLSEMEAIMGDDQKLIDDIVEAAEELQPAFIAVAGTPIPIMTGFDFESIAAMIEQRTGIPAFGFATTGMNTYIHGASMALEAYARRFVDKHAEKTRHLSANILGLTPLDFSVNGSDQAIAEFLEKNGFEVISRWAMGSTPQELTQAGKAQVNLVVSASGLGVAKYLEKTFGTPYVVGVPIGSAYAEKLADELKDAAVQSSAPRSPRSVSREKDALYKERTDGEARDIVRVVVIGEGITSLSLARALEAESLYETGSADAQKLNIRLICPTECDPEILREYDILAQDEEEIEEALTGADLLIADPLYRPICPGGTKFVPLPAESFSGRIYRKDIPNLIREFDSFVNMIYEKGE